MKTNLAAEIYEIFARRLCAADQSGNATAGNNDQRMPYQHLIRQNQSKGRLMDFQLGKHDLTRLPPEVVPANVDAGAVGAVAVPSSTGDTARWAQRIDVAISLPELIDRFQRCLVGAVTARESEGELGQRFGVRVQPTLILCRQGATLDLIAKPQVLSNYIDGLSKLIDRPRASGASADKNIIPQRTQRNLSS
ncbi:hydrogenase accessory protein [Bradyrhizobium sp. USDA 10063]